MQTNASSISSFFGSAAGALSPLTPVVSDSDFCWSDLDNSRDFFPSVFFLQSSESSFVSLFSFFAGFVGEANSC
jgi:hypothetical protein